MALEQDPHGAVLQLPASTQARGFQEEPPQLPIESSFVGTVNQAVGVWLGWEDLKISSRNLTFERVYVRTECGQGALAL